MKMNPTPVNMTTKQAHEYLCLHFSAAKAGSAGQKIIKRLTKEYKAERKAGIHSAYTPTSLQNKALGYLEGLQGVTPSWLNEA